MKLKQFNTIVEARLKQCAQTLIPKGEEYSRNGDRLWNFGRAGVLQGVQPETALVGMWTKHLVSVLDIVDDIEDGFLPPTRETIAEKIGDTINYALLLEALIEDRRAYQDD